MRVFLEKVNGEYQGASFPFREGFSSGVLRLRWGTDNAMFVGMTSRGWNSTGPEPYGLQRLRWTGKMPFEIKRINITPDGFKIAFTKPVEATTGNNPQTYKLTTFTHPYHGAYGGPEIDQTAPVVKSVKVSEDGMFATLVLDKMLRGHVYDFDLGLLRAKDKEDLLHRKAYYTVNEVPTAK